MKEDRLDEIVNRWKEWARNADTREEGWQALFPDWTSLIGAAVDTMKNSRLSSHELKNVELCWLISEEDEDMADEARKCPNNYWVILQQLAASSHPEVRWQVYDVIATCGKRSEALLRDALNDLDAYCRKRALLALSKLEPQDFAAIVKKFASDPDLHNREMAEALLKGLS